MDHFDDALPYLNGPRKLALPHLKQQTLEAYAADLLDRAEALPPMEWSFEDRFLAQSHWRILCR